MTSNHPHGSADMPVTIRRALVSVSEKAGLIDFAFALRDLGIEIVSTGGTAAALRKGGISAIDVADVTGFPEILDGRVKTLHPRIHAGILARRDNPNHEQQLRQHGLAPIDLVVVNLYPFESTIARPDVPLDQAIEQIDIGGPTLIRAAAKNFEDVAVLVDPGDYPQLLMELRRDGGSLSRTRRLYLARKAFTHIARYDTLIAGYFDRQIEAQGEPGLPDLLDLRLLKLQRLRYGENPHQQAALYRDVEASGPSVATAKQLHGKELSYNNFLDLDAALSLAAEFDQPAAAIIKHTNPCGVAVDSSLLEAYRRARAADQASAYGGVLGLNRQVDAATARDLRLAFVEAVLAPGYSEEALAMLKTKSALRLLVIEPWPSASPPDRTLRELRSISGGMLVQEEDRVDVSLDCLRVVTRRQPTETEMRACRFAWKVVKHVRSNAIVLAAEQATVGIGAGQMSRVDSCRLAVMKAGSAAKGAVLASDAFFPFRDGVDVVAAAGVTAVIQPGGSVRDEEVIRAADEAGITMLFTGIRHFRH